MKHFYLDLETYNEVPLSVGTHRYAESVEVMLVAYAIDDGPVQVLDLTVGARFAITLPDEAIVVMHNAAFDATMLRHALGIDFPPERIHDTMAAAYSHSLPGALAQLCAVLKIPAELGKQERGKELVQLFCKPRPKNQKLRRATAATHPSEWAEFVDYAKHDVLAMREVYKRLPRWNYPAAREHAIWVTDQRINNRGFHIDAELVEAAIAATDAHRELLAARVEAATHGEVSSALQRDALLAHLLIAFGIELPDMQASTLERRLEDASLPEVARELISARLSTSTTSVAKYGKLRVATSSDGRMRGTAQYCGAARTGRWAHRVFQPGNLPRPTMKPAAVEQGIEALKLGCAHLLADPMAVASSAIRGTIVAAPGRTLMAADLANIEGRGLAWLAAEEWKLQAFRDYDAGTGPDLYRLAYARGFHMKPEEVSDEQRQIGKVEELALGYQGGLGAFDSMAKVYGLELPAKTVRELVRAWRAANPKIVAFWYSLDRAAREAIRSPGREHAVGPVALDRIAAWLRVRLPSGRVLCYPSPALASIRCKTCKGTGVLPVEDPEPGEAAVEECFRCEGATTVNAITYWGVDQYTRKWQRLDTYGGKLAENITQAFSRDVMAEGMLRAEAAGLPVVLTVHDEVVAETTPEREVEELVACLVAPIEWAHGLPLAAKGFKAVRYRKD